MSKNYKTGKNMWYDTRRMDDDDDDASVEGKGLVANDDMLDERVRALASQQQQELVWLLLSPL